VEAVRINHPLTVHSTSPGSEAIEGTDSSPYEVTGGSWLVTHSDGTQSFMDDDSFSEIYEEVVIKRGPGRPPGSGAVTAVAAPKRRRRRRHRAKGTEKKAA
jgi:hypothetical protein